MKVFRVIPEFWIFEIVSLKMLNYADYNSFSSLESVYLHIINHLNANYSYSVDLLQILRFEFLKFRILEFINFHPCTW